MVITNLRKVVLVGAKLSIFITIFFLQDACIAQEIVQKEFNGDNGLAYKFGVDSFRTETRYAGIHSKKKISKGTYTINGDTLVLNYVSFKNPPNPEFEFIRRRPLYNNEKSDSTSVFDELYVHFKIVGENNNPIFPHPILLIKNSENQTIEGFEADSLGNIPEIFMFGKFDVSFKFTSLANEEFVIEPDTLMGYKSTVNVSLPKRIEYGTFDGTKKYLIKRQGENIIELQSLTDKKVVRLVKD